MAINQPSAAQFGGPGLAGLEAPHGLGERPVGSQGQPSGGGLPYVVTPTWWSASPLVMVVAVPLGVIFAPHIHHHIALGQELGVPGPHHLCVLLRHGVRLRGAQSGTGENGDLKGEMGT